ncbi:phage portal protein [Allokutzneria sp. A3M-2-11 16]|uniref:phage portal protein n=1 Tax=Allokutzneria sp. A3M-2-11 16 TaxID=2962043 RepID=UPI0020B72033|nr:phage portal protein [Allokutzneria sp. A3M-2-11 16]MCP3800193.1 phage portal protein [Allokutzneria sp. A3M-2-11 16]
MHRTITGGGLMGFLDFLAAPVETRSATAIDPAEATTNAELGGAEPALAAKALTPRDALAVSAVYACVRLLSDTIATTPVGLFKRTTTGTREPLDRPSWLTKPNPDTRWIEFVATVMTSLLLEGNAYILVTRAGAEILALDVIPVSAVTPKYLKRGKGRRELIYELSLTGEDGAQEVVGALSREDVLHIKGMPLTGSLTGVSPLDAARRTIGLSLAAQEFGAEFFENGATPGAVISVPGTMTPAGLRAARQTWRAIHGGAGNRHGLAILTEDAKFQKVTISPDEAQFLETRAFQIPDIARLYGVPPHLIADASGSTSWGSGLSEQNTAFVQFAVRAWAERLEEGLTALLGDDAVSAGEFVRFNLDALARGALAERLESYRTGIQNGIYARDEVRALEDLPPDPSGLGGFLMVPTNLAILTPDGPMALTASSDPSGDTDDTTPDGGDETEAV